LSDLPELRRAALEIFRAALASVDAGAAVRRAVRLDGPRLFIGDEAIDLSASANSIYAIAIGKAALPMAMALDEILGERLTAGLLTASPYENAHEAAAIAPSFMQRWRAEAGGHPLPNEASLRAASHALSLLRRADEECALVIFLISGGGSAMLEWPRNERAPLEDLREANRLLVACGASINEINSVRRAFSAVKGGQLASHAPRAQQVTLIVSDTGPNDEATVASGPTLAPPQDAPDALEVIARYNLRARLPASILAAIETQEDAQAPARATTALRLHYTLLDNRRAVEAAAEAARERGFIVETAPDIIEQPIAEGCAELLRRLRALHSRLGQSGETNLERAVCLVSGGEFACPLRGAGVGGRNAETVLRWAIELDSWTRRQKGEADALAHTVALSAGTDGIDGNSPAAGALADEETIRRSLACGMDAGAFLAASDAYTFFDALGDAILTGRTGTNVRDLRLLLAR
jgi:hydroxypyruvate reductase